MDDILIKTSLVNKLKDLVRTLEETRNLFEPRISSANNLKKIAFGLILAPCTILAIPAVVAGSSALLAGSGVAVTVGVVKATGVIGGTSGAFTIASCSSLGGLSKKKINFCSI